VSGGRAPQRGLAVAVALLAGCQARVAPPIARTPIPLASVPAATGVIEGGVYQDRDWPLRWVVPPGWAARAGAGDGWRVRVHHAGLGAAWEVWAGPAASAACPDDWWPSFTSTGPFRGPFAEAHVATCISAEPEAGRCWTWRPTDGAPWALRLWLPPHHAGPAVEAGLAALAGLTWGGG